MGTIDALLLPWQVDRSLQISSSHVDNVYSLKGFTLAGMAVPPRLSWNLRVSSEDQDLIDRAVAASGKTRTSFVLEAARRAAVDTLVEQSWLQVAPERLTAFLECLDAPPQPNPRLRATLAAEPPWQE